MRSLVLTVALCMALCGCGSGGGTQPPRQTRVSDVGEFVTNLDLDGHSVPVFRYQGVRVEGDMLMADYDDALALVAPHLQASEPVIRVIDYRVFPASYPRMDLGGGNVEVESCNDGHPDQCASGHWWGVLDLGSEWAIAASGGWILNQADHHGGRRSHRETRGQQTPDGRRCGEPTESRRRDAHGAVRVGPIPGLPGSPGGRVMTRGRET